MSSSAPDLEAIPAVEPLITDVIATTALAAHAYLSADSEKAPDISDAQIAIDVAAFAFESIKDRLRPEQRLAITQMLTETRLTFIKKRGV
ncbi:MAG: hypothetical protein M3Y21_11475 [Candidatus Eremiobacteraeota bacterium]|nr:hypothetical protein [Candidatus Eremiobacteraeota bacterium]